MFTVVYDVVFLWQQEKTFVDHSSTNRADTMRQDNVNGGTKESQSICQNLQSFFEKINPDDINSTGPWVNLNLAEGIRNNAFERTAMTWSFADLLFLMVSQKRSMFAIFNWIHHAITFSLFCRRRPWNTLLIHLSILPSCDQVASYNTR